MSRLFAQIPISLEADKDLNALVPQFQDSVEPAIPGEVPLVEGCVGCQLLGLEVG